MESAKKPKRVKKLNLQQDLFCKLFATDPTVFGNASHAYSKAYGNDNMFSAQVAVNHLLMKPEITARINEYLSKEGFNDVSVDKKHNFLIHQFNDFNVSLKAIEQYNKLKKRIENKIELVIPKPVMELEDDEVILKIDKSKAKDMPKDGSIEP